MKMVVFLGLMVFSIIASSDTIQQEIQKLINQHDDLYVLCKQDQHDEVDTGACSKTLKIFNELGSKGWCFGHDGQPNSEKDWEPCVKKESASSQPKSIDFDKAALAMYSNYIGYRNGVAAMYSVENECWNTARKSLQQLDQCSAYAITGGFIEASFAFKQRRSPVPNYQAQSIKKRIVENYLKSGFSEKDSELTRKYMGDNLNSILSGLMNAGMK